MRLLTGADYKRIETEAASLMPALHAAPDEQQDCSRG
jgi:hypothetical protein